MRSTLARPAPRALALVALVALVAVVPAVAAGCSSVAVPGAVQAGDSVVRSVPVGANPTVRIEMFNGSIDVVAGAAGSVSATVKRTGEGATTADAQADARKIEVTLEAAGDTVTLTAVYTPSPNNVTGGRGASAVVSVPAGSALDLQTSNGEIGTTGVAGHITARTSNGGIGVNGAASWISLETSNGEVAVRGPATSVKAKTSNGTVTVDGASGVIDVESSSGAIALAGIRSGTVTAKTSNGGIAFDGTFADGSQRFETTNGPVALTLPPATSFTVDATTSNGTATTDFPLSSGSATGTAIDGAVGQAPAIQLTIRTSNGNITIARGS
jgi:DUF4097 and DUF4098 domain-containing protein YvlB